MHLVNSEKISKPSVDKNMYNIMLTFNQKYAIDNSKMVKFCEFITIYQLSLSALQVAIYADVREDKNIPWKLRFITGSRNCLLLGARSVNKWFWSVQFRFAADIKCRKRVVRRLTTCRCRGRACVCCCAMTGKLRKISSINTSKYRLVCLEDERTENRPGGRCMIRPTVAVVSISCIVCHCLQVHFVRRVPCHGNRSPIHGSQLSIISWHLNLPLNLTLPLTLTLY